MSVKPMLSLSFNDLLQAELHKYIGQIRVIESGGNLHEMIVDIVEKSLLEVTLQETGGNQTEAAHILGLNRNTLRRKIDSHGLDLSQFGKNGNGNNGVAKRQ